MPGESAEGLLRRLEAVLAGYGPTLVAFSGGVDSTLVAVAAHRALGERCLAVTGVSPSLSQRDREHAVRLATQLGLTHRLLETREMARDGYRANAGDRCYHCKTELFERMQAMARDEGFAALATGENLDDLGGHRPGLAAAREGGVRHPLVEAAMTKADIRQLAHHLGLPNHDRPASPCLASRVPQGIEVSPEVLARIDAAEAGVRALGFEEFRVRHHHDLARIEVPEAALPRAVQLRAELLQACLAAGYRFATLDLRGFASGSLSAAYRERGEVLVLPDEG